jgi:glycosyltransferase involved in cell wall biosynthesis
MLLLDVMAQLHAADPEWRLVIVGDGPMRTQLDARTEELGLAEVVDVRGYVPIDGELPRLYRSADAFLHVSWTEGVPQVLFEAFALGLPVVATAVGGIGDALADSALLVPPDDPQAAAAALLRIAGDHQLRARLVWAGLATARRCTREAECERVTRFLAEAFGAQPPGTDGATTATRAPAAERVEFGIRA